MQKSREYTAIFIVTESVEDNVCGQYVILCSHKERLKKSHRNHVCGDLAYGG